MLCTHSKYVISASRINIDVYYDIKIDARNGNKTT